MKLNLSITPFKNWFPGFEKPVLIAGPCSAETEEQVLLTAHAIADNYPHAVFRAGIWKPRTRPNTFEGVGNIGLDWLQTVKQETGLKTATEVANAQHVEACLKKGVDVLWIGARTTVNPFSVQEIADALRGVSIPVLVKNPINPDLQLWVGALERINSAGITRLAAIHRGFHSYETSAFRNNPKWEIPIELKMLCPDLPVICDPSHICGNIELLPYIAQKALDMDMSGLMLETHIAPEKALSDATQQLHPEDLNKLVTNLTVRKSSSDDVDFKNRLDDLRYLIDRSDEDILNVMLTRMQIVKKIGEYKRVNNVAVLQAKRWKEILNNQLKSADNLGLNKEFIKRLYALIHEESIRMQTEIMNKSEVVGRK